MRAAWSTGRESFILEKWPLCPALANPWPSRITPPFLSNRPAKGHAVAVLSCDRGFVPQQETRNAQTEDQIGRQKALPLHRERQDQSRSDRQAPRHDQALERADPGIARDARPVRLRNPAHQALDAIRGLREEPHVKSSPRRRRSSA